MQWLKQYWIAIVVAVVSVGAGVGLAMMSSGANKPPRTVTPTVGNNESIFNTYAPGVGDDLSNLVSPLTNISNTTKKVTPGTYPTPLPLPVVPWGTGASDHPSPSTGGSPSNPGTATPLPPDQVPWGTGPSQQ